MIEESFSLAKNLIGTTHYFPRRMISAFAEVNPEAFSSIFINLFDESIDVYKKITSFSTKSEEVCEKHESI